MHCKKTNTGVWKRQKLYKSNITLSHTFTVSLEYEEAKTSIRTILVIWGYQYSKLVSLLAAMVAVLVVKQERLVDLIDEK